MTAPPPPPAGDPKPTRATFTDVTHKGKPFEVHFNPASLQIALANTLEEKGQGKDKKQYVSKSSAKLTVDLVYDTTTTGDDVRTHTGKVARFMEAEGADEKKRTPPTVLFEWGTFKFQGLVESYKETIDFFSHDGIPLRASVNLTMSRQEVVFTDDKAKPKSTAVDAPPTSGDATQIATQAGNPGGGRGLAAANGLESMRFPSGPVSLDASIPLGGPVAFATGGAGIGLGVSGGFSAGISGGAGIGISGGISGGASFGAGVGGGFGLGAGASAGVSFGASAGASFGAGASLGAGASFGASAGAGASASFGAGASFGASASASAGFSARASVSATGVALVGPAFGGSASARVPASMGAFAGLRATARVSGPPLDPSRLLPRVEATGVAVGPRASFGLGGRASVEGSASFGTDVGASASASASAGVRFDGG